MSRTFPRLLPAVFFLCLTAAVTYPWFFSPGFLFLLDFVWPPTLPPPPRLRNVELFTSLPHEWVWWAVATVLPTPLVQKVAFSLPIFLAGLSMFQLARWLLRERPTERATIAALTAGTLYALNPFAVTRVFMGAYYLLLANALLPWALLTVLKFLHEPSRRRGVLAGLTAAGVMVTNAHHVFLLPLLLAPFAYRPRWPMGRRVAIAWFLAPLVLFFVAAAALRLLGSSSGASLPFNPLGPWARALQAPYSGNLLLDSFFLTATWKLDLPFAFPYEVLPGSGILAGLFLITMAVGAASAWRKTETGPLVRRLLLIGGIGLFLTIGVAHPLTEPAAAWLYRHVPFWIGMRDSAKFLALVALAESLFLGLGVAALATAVTRRVRIVPPAGELLPACFLAAALFMVSPALQGFGGHITPSQYPESWHEWNRRLGEEPRPASAQATDFDPSIPSSGSRDELSRVAGKPRMLFLPWHQYLPFSFTDDRTVVNPAPRFFTNAEVVSGDNSEVGGSGHPFIYSESARPLSKTIEGLLREAPPRTDFGSRIAAAHVRFVALANDTVDTADYAFLRHQADLRLVFEAPELLVWENTTPSTNHEHCGARQVPPPPPPPPPSPPPLPGQSGQSPASFP